MCVQFPKMLVLGLSAGDFQSGTALLGREEPWELEALRVTWGGSV